MTQASYLKQGDHTIAYHHHKGKHSAQSPGIVFLSGFRSDMQGTKALYLQDFCEKHDIQYTRFDYSGHGESSGAFNELCLSDWAEDSLAIIEQVTQGPQILIGSSMGGWLMMLCALKIPDKIAGLIGIAPAPDFTEELLGDRLPKEQVAEILEKGFIDLPSCYDDMVFTITRKLLDDGKNHLLLDKESLDIHCPLSIIQSMKDDDVPYEKALKISKIVKSEVVNIHLLKDGDHRLSRDQDLTLLLDTTERMLDLLNKTKLS